MVYNRAHYPKSEKMEVLENRTEPERYAVEARVFKSGVVTARVRPAESWEKTRCSEGRMCAFCIDVFDDEESAEMFWQQYWRARGKA